MTTNEVIHPPRGYTILIHDTQAIAMVGCWATEDEARQALSNANIAVVGAPSGWHQQCGSMNGPMVCTLPRGPHTWHDNGAVAWPADDIHDHGRCASDECVCEPDA